MIALSMLMHTNMEQSTDNAGSTGEYGQLKGLNLKLTAFTLFSFWYGYPSPKNTYLNVETAACRTPVFWAKEYMEAAAAATTFIYCVTNCSNLNTNTLFPTNVRHKYFARDINGSGESQEYRYMEQITSSCRIQGKIRQRLHSYVRASSS